jgi:hypothetical protein
MQGEPAGSVDSNSTIYSSIYNNNLTQDTTTTTYRLASFAWPDLNKHHVTPLLNHTTPSNPFLASFGREDNFYLITDSPPALNPASNPALLPVFGPVFNPALDPALNLALDLDPAFLDKPFNGRYLYNVLGCPLTFTRLAD